MAVSWMALWGRVSDRFARGGAGGPSPRFRDARPCATASESERDRSRGNGVKYPSGHYCT